MAAVSSPEGVIRLIRSPAGNGIGVFRIDAAGKSAFYTFREIPCFIGGRGFAVHRLGLGELYHVRVGEPKDCSCECLGYLAHGHCRHILGLLALVREGKLGSDRLGEDQGPAARCR
jgi:hypothetical protein